MNRIKMIALLYLLLQNTFMFCQESWSLDACVEYAIQHNLKQNDLTYTTDSEKEKYRQSFRELLPTVTAYSSYGIQYGRSVDPNNNAIVSSDFFSNNYSIIASIDIFRGFQKTNTIKSTKLVYQATQEEALQEKYMLTFRVITAYYDVQFFKGLVEISKEQAAISLTNYNLVEKKIELGLSAGADLYEAESILIADQLAASQSENNLKNVTLKLIQEMNLQNTTSIITNGLQEDFIQEEALQNVSADTIYKNALSFMPLIKGQELRVRAAQKDIMVARGSLYPSLMLESRYGTGYFETNVDALGAVIPFNTQINDNASYYVGASLRIPILERWSSRSRIKQQKIAALRAENNLNIQKQELNQVIQELVQTFDGAIVEYELTKQSEASSVLAFKIAQKKYDKGLISVLELNQTKNLLATAQNLNLQARLKLKINEKTLEFYKGIPIFNINRLN